MRGKLAKRIRKVAYQDMALKSDKVVEQKSFLTKIIETLKGERISRYTVRNIGLRKKYQDLKKSFKKLAWNVRHAEISYWEDK